MKKIYILHGWAIDAHNESKWKKFRDFFDSEKISTIFLKIPGLDTSLKRPWNLSDYVEWLEETLPDEKVILLGHSFGGQLSIRFAAEFSNRVEKLILVDSSGIIDKSLSKRFKRKVFYYLAKIGKLFTHSNFLRKMLYKVAREKDYYLADEVMKKTMQNVISEEIVLDLPKITLPTLILWGENDTATPISFARVLHQGIENSTLEVISGARHAPQFTHPRVTAEHIKTFLKG